MHPPILEALDARPDEAATWEVLADWLEETGDARAEFLRLTRDVEFPDPDLPDELHQRLTTAAKAAQSAWFGARDVADLGLVWHRGFISHANVTPKHADLLAHPAMRFVRELNVSGFERFELPLRHQLRVLRCEGVERLPELPPLDLLVLLHPKRVETTGAVPKRLIVSDSHDPEVHARPRYAPMNFRALPPEIAPGGDGFSDWGGSSRKIGSGIVNRHRRLLACGACGSRDFAQIFDGYWKFKENYSKTYTFREEIWCRDCGVFSFFERHTED